MIQAHATARYVRTSAQKAGLVLDLIRGKDVNRALATLTFTRKGVAEDIAKVLRSAIANAQHKEGFSGDVDRLFVSACYANQGPSAKRVRPAPMGRAFRVLKRTAHLTVHVSERAEKVVAIASANMTNEEARVAKSLFEGVGARVGLTVDPIDPIRMKSRTEWLVGTQAAPNYRGVAAILGENEIPSMDSIDVLYICDADFSQRANDPAFIASLRKAKFLIVHSWDANHPLNEVADVLLPATIHVEKEGSYTNLQSRVQEIHAAYPPKGQAIPDVEIFARVAARVLSEERVAAGA